MEKVFYKIKKLDVNNKQGITALTWHRLYNIKMYKIYKFWRTKFDNKLDSNLSL